MKKSVIGSRIRRDPPVNMSVLEACFYVGISERKLRELIARGDIRYVRLGSRIILRKQDIDSWLEGMVA
jgi:excisionase family DNA binding protein